MGTVLRNRSTVQLIAQGLIQALKSLLRDLPSKSHDVSQWNFIRETLEALPLSTNEFGVAASRLRNAQHYCNQGEFGAAQFELRQLDRTFRSQAFNFDIHCEVDFLD